MGDQWQFKKAVQQQAQRIVEETLKPGASLSLVARAQDVKANQVFQWRKPYREGRLEIAPSPNALSRLRKHL
jgi:transposase-like protein